MSDEQQTCAICLDSTDLISMPCCGRDESTTRFCLRCIEVVCTLAPNSRGSCPKCRAEIMVKQGVVVKAPENVGRCRMCRQGNKVLVEAGMCDACALGSQHALHYECDRCHRTQRIPHPMWRYQPSPDQFGSATWACHQRCGDYTYWRCVPQDLPSVPSWDRPAGWAASGLDEDVVQRVRTHLGLQRLSQSPPQPPPTPLQPPPARSRTGPGCVIA